MPEHRDGKDRTARGRTGIITTLAEPGQAGDPGTPENDLAVLRDRYPSADVWYVRDYDGRVRWQLAVHGDTPAYLEEALMNTAADAAWGARAAMLDVLPEWARELAAQCPDYTFSQCELFLRKSVAAVRAAPGTGPDVVITSDEAEMRAALSLPMNNQPDP